MYAVHTTTSKVSITTQRDLPFNIAHERHISRYASEQGYDDLDLVLSPTLPSSDVHIR
jgi:hypothetical protein